VTHEGSLSQARAVLERELASIDAACSRFRADSELTRLNAAAGRPVAVSATLLEAVQAALDGAATSDGLVDPTVGRTLRLAGYDSTFEAVRMRDGRSFRARFAPVTGWQRIEIDPGECTVRVPPGTELDLGATAKALAADRIARGAAAAVGGGVLVSLGGDVAVAGEAPDGAWPIRVADDHTAPVSGPGPIVTIRSGGLATSGTAVRRWRSGRSELHHIVDPRTGRPALTTWRTVSVAAASCVDANVASTAAVILGPDGPGWLLRRRLPARLVGTRGGTVCVAGWPARAG
jgi:thiamine biosynthesis lipoprotein